MFSTYNLKSFGKALRDIRKRNGLSQKDVRGLCGISEEGLRKIEHGDVIPKYETLEILSTIYSIDLHSLMGIHRNNQDLINIYSHIDKIMETFNYSELIFLEESLESLFKHSNCLDLINQKELSRLQLFLEVSKLYFDHHYDSQVLFEYIEQAMALSNPTFNIHDFLNEENNSHIYSDLDIRFITLLALEFARIDDFKKSTSILIFCLNHMNYSPVKTTEKTHIKLKLYFNITYNYHRLSNHPKAYDYACKGVELALKNDTLYCLPALLFRKGISEFRLKKENYIKTLIESISLQFTQNHEEAAKQVLGSLKTNYQIDLYNYFEAFL